MRGRHRCQDQPNCARRHLPSKPSELEWKTVLHLLYGKEINERMPVLPTDGAEHLGKEGPLAWKHLVWMTGLVSKKILFSQNVLCGDRL